MTKDKYDKAVEYLTKHPDEIHFAWNRPHTARGGCLFQYAQNTDSTTEFCGCLTQIRGGFEVAQTPELTEAILRDIRLPCDEDDITVDDLPIFAEWQRRIDKELNRV